MTITSVLRSGDTGGDVIPGCVIGGEVVGGTIDRVSVASFNIRFGACLSRFLFFSTARTDGSKEKSLLVFTCDRVDRRSGNDGSGNGDSRTTAGHREDAPLISSSSSSSSGSRVFVRSRPGFLLATTSVAAIGFERFVKAMTSMSSLLPRSLSVVFVLWMWWWSSSSSWSSCRDAAAYVTTRRQPSSDACLAAFQSLFHQKRDDSLIVS